MKGVFLALTLLFALATAGGGAVLASGAAVNRGLALKSAERQRLYFETDADAKRFLLYTNLMLSDAETFAVEYICAEGYAQKTYKELSVAVQDAVHSSFLASSGGEGFDKAAFAAEAFRTVYFHKAYVWLKERLEMFYTELAAEKASAGIVKWTSPDIHLFTADPEVVSGIRVEGAFYSTDFNYRLNVTLNVQAPSFDLFVNEISTEGWRKGGTERYNVEKWVFSAMPI